MGAGNVWENPFWSINLGSCRETAAHNFFTALRWKIKSVYGSSLSYLREGPGKPPKAVETETCETRER